MRYCPYCGAGLTEDSYLFCSECGKEVSINKEESAPERKARKKQNKRKPKSKRRFRRKTQEIPKAAVESDMVEDGYDGYYDDIQPIDAGKVRQSIDKDMLKRIAGLLIGVLITICACVAIMYLL